MQVHTMESLAVRDALDEFEIACQPLRMFWIDRRERTNLCALNAVVDGAAELADALVDYGPGHHDVVGQARQLYLWILSLLRVLEADRHAPGPAASDARDASISFLDVPAEYGYGTRCNGNHGDRVCTTARSPSRG